jgi:hypothetical protein
MKIEIDYDRETISVNDLPIAFAVLSELTTGPTPGPWWRVVRRDHAITVENASSALLLEQWVKDGRGL